MDGKSLRQNPEAKGFLARKPCLGFFQVRWAAMRPQEEMEGRPGEMQLFISLVPERQGLGLGHGAQTPVKQGEAESPWGKAYWGQGGYTSESRACHWGI